MSISNSIFIYLMDSYSEEKLHWVNHTNHVIDETHRFIGHMKDAETGQRGYLLTSDVSYLEPYYSGIGMANLSLEKLNELVADNPHQNEILRDIEHAMTLKLDELKLTIDLHEAGEIEAALNVVRDNSGKFHMDRIRGDIERFVNTERLLLAERESDYIAHRTQISTLIVVELILFVSLAIFSLNFLQRNLFDPLNLLLKSTKKMEKGEIVDVEDITKRDEMGYLLASFYRMNLKVHKRVSHLDHTAHHDELTGVRNRVNLHPEIDQLLEMTEFKTAIIFMDLNKFKQLNDTLGHKAGDEVLKETAKRLKKTTRAGDIIYRYGGDEFIAVIEGITDISNLEMVVEKIRSNFLIPMNIYGQGIIQSLSIGVVIAPDHGTSAADLIKKADEAMYQSKTSSDNSYVIYESEV